MKKSFGVVHCVVQCRDCGWYTEVHKNGQANAARHAKAHCHDVDVEVGISGVYYGRGLKDGE